MYFTLTFNVSAFKPSSGLHRKQALICCLGHTPVMHLIIESSQPLLGVGPKHIQI